ncbi:sigma-54-dependent transcriptional regulator [Sedimenticola hydrogenitrophicus]|uniref:sigma-54-dependent transcriptional regulator n=1 Tax=Sedimenticola hydrogenitrophicus TaxID=2967975 RepID=UPI0021A5BA7C|nr:sigma-54 dependent transcriptional regulator [Sedimenticola hydrogenitrophicus]
MKHRICLIEDDEILGEALADRFAVEGFDCDWFKDGSSALPGLRKPGYSVAVSDIHLPDITGEVLYRGLLEAGSVPPPFLFITGYGAVDQAVRLLKLGAEDYLTKPFAVAELLNKVRALCERQIPGDSGSLPLGGSPGMKAIEAMLPRLAASASTVLVTGESGVGKEYVARALHQAGDPDGGKPFIAVNCGAIPESLLEAELFGYLKGAFTGAVRDKRGYFEQAHDGTLFLDEIGDMPLPMQVRLLRAVQERQITRIGAERSTPVDIRLICATHRDLAVMVEAGEFREDLYYRINVVNIHVPPLRERPEDILWYARLFLDELAECSKDRPCALHPRAEQALLAYPWPGNVRELRNCLERACVFNQATVLTPEGLFGDAWSRVRNVMSGQREERLADYIQQCERDYISRVLNENEGRIANTAAALGISRKTLWDKMRKLGLNESE